MFKTRHTYREIEVGDRWPGSSSSFYREPAIVKTRHRLTYGKFAGGWDAITNELAYCSNHGYGDATVELDIIKDGCLQTIVDVIVIGPESTVNEFWQRIRDRHNL